MASWENGFGYEPSGQDAEIDTIDLTLSSPEPEQRPRAPPQQQRLPTYVKKEPRTDFGNNTRMKAERKAPEMKPNRARKQPRPVHPQHLAQIVNTSDFDAVRDVLLDLCKLSPALSGAVARGLAPHSTFAQSIIKQQQQAGRVPSSRPPKNEESDGQSAYERMNRRLAAESSARGSRVNNARSSSNLATHSAPFAASRSVPRIKQEYQIDATDSDSDLDSYIPGSFPLSPRRLQPERLPLRGASSSSTTNQTTRPYSFPERFARVQGGSNIKHETEVKTCTQCKETIEDEFGNCFYHPGPFVRSGEVDICDNCKGPVSDIGCSLGIHTNELDVERNALGTGRTGGSRSPSKRPRMY